MGGGRRYSEVDLLLLEALAEFERGLCKGCGSSLQFTTVEETVENINAFTVGSATCRGCSALEAVTDAKKGEKLYVINGLLDGE